MDLFAAVRRCVVEKYADFSGRASRSEFWWFMFAASLMTVPFSLLAPLGTGYVVASWAVALPLTVPWLAVLVRRLHDTGRSGWTTFVALVPLVGLPYLVWLLCTATEPFDNRFGPRCEMSSSTR